ncbi:SFT2 family protein [Cardiosporidium cionae]|uniref:Vesicle transport protein n=1 Tax=Cardiosporidium cionae TaxID=476202 RepID=A0ABQ7JG94_9APIC|nr:SFT2 family protein [Cardiosporidium cionae]|eukprot:KAF8823017.1 SFT2 family protein [Cardiosporidium cionae]
MLSLVKDPDDEEGRGTASAPLSSVGNAIGNAASKLNFIKPVGSSAGYSQLGNADISGGMQIPSSSGQESSVLEKGLSAAKAGATTVASGARNLITTAQSTIVDSPLMLNPQRIFYSAITAGVGLLFILLSFMLLPIAVLSPSKFSLPYTIGSLCIFASLGVLKGFTPLYNHMVSTSRLPFTIAYASSVALTLLFTLFFRSYLLVIIFSIAQVASLLSFVISYLPGGTQILKTVGNSIWNTISSCFGLRPARESNLPF